MGSQIVLTLGFPVQFMTSHNFWRNLPPILPYQPSLHSSSQFIFHISTNSLLESKKKELGITALLVSLTTLEEVFLRITSKVYQLCSTFQQMLFFFQKLT